MPSDAKRSGAYSSGGVFDVQGGDVVVPIRAAIRVFEPTLFAVTVERPGGVVVSKRERVIALEPHEKGLIGTTLHYPYEVRGSAEYFDDIPDIKISDEMLKLAEHILDTKAGDFDPTAFEDHYETALVELLRKKQDGFKPPKHKEVAAPRNVINLMDALRRSVEAERGVEHYAQALGLTSGHLGRLCRLA